MHQNPEFQTSMWKSCTGDMEGCWSGFTKSNKMFADTWGSF